MLTFIVCLALAAPEPRFVAHPLIASGVDPSLVVPLQDAFRVTAARQPVSPVASFAVKEALAGEPGRSCAGPDDRECLLRLLTATGAPWVVVAVAAPEGAGLRLSARVVDATGATLRESSQLVMVGARVREQLEGFFSTLFGELSLATLGESAQPPPVVVVPPPPKTETAPAIASSGLGPLRATSVGVMGAGLVAGGLGAVLLATAEGEAGKLRETLGPAGVHPDLGSAETARRLDSQWAAGQVALVAGGSLLVGGLVLFLVGAPAAAARPAVVLVPSSTGLLLGVSGPLP